MARTKPKAKKGTSKPEPRATKNEKRKHEEGGGGGREGDGNGNGDGEGELDSRPAKKRAVKDREISNASSISGPLAEPEEQTSISIEQSAAAGASAGASASAKPNTHNTSSAELALPTQLRGPLAEELSRTCVLTGMSIISSSSMQKKAARALELLRAVDSAGGAQIRVGTDTGPGAKEGKERKERGDNKNSIVVVLYAKAKAATKLISIAEIIKRELRSHDGTTCFQYNAVGSMVEEKVNAAVATKGRTKSAGARAKGKAAKDVDVDVDMGEGEEEEAHAEDQDSEEEDEDEGFETMKTPFERAIEGKVKVRAVPTMTIYLSRVRVDALRKKYGEQTNGVEKKS